MAEAATDEQSHDTEGMWIALGGGAGMVLGAAEGGIGAVTGLVLGAGAGLAYKVAKSRTN